MRYLLILLMVSTQAFGEDIDVPLPNWVGKGEGLRYSHLSPAIRNGFYGGTTKVRPLTQCGFAGHMYSDGLWRADLGKCGEHNVVLFTAANNRYFDLQQERWVWTEPVWVKGTGWQLSKKLSPWPRLVSRVTRQLCFGTYCISVNTLEFFY